MFHSNVVFLAFFLFLSCFFFEQELHAAEQQELDSLRQMMGVSDDSKIDDAVERAQSQRIRKERVGKKATVTELLDATDRLQAIMPDLRGVDVRLLMPDQKEKLIKTMHKEGLLTLGGYSMGNPCW